MYVYDILLNLYNVAHMYVFSADNLRSQHIREVITIYTSKINMLQFLVV